MKSIITVVLLVLSLNVLGQNNIAENNYIKKSLVGRERVSVQGQVLEMIGGSKSPVSFANVILKNSTTGVMTDIDGYFSIMIPTDKQYILVISSMGYQTVEKLIDTSLGRNISIVIKEDSNMLDTIEIKAKTNKESAIVLLADRKNAVEMTQKIGASKLSDIGASDASQGVAKVTGVAKNNSNSGAVFVRGLGDRYNNVTLNGFSIPSTSSSAKSAPLDIFSTDIISNLSISKTYDVTSYGDFAGANININTKGSTSKQKLYVGIGTSANSQVTFKDFKTYKGGSSDFFGFDNVRDKLPKGANANESYGKLNNNFESKEETAKPELSFNMFYNNNFYIGENSSFGVLAYSGFSNDYSFRDYQTADYNAQGGTKKRFKGDKSKYSTNFTNLLSLNYNIGGVSLDYTSMYINSSSDEVSVYKGFDSSEEADYLMTGIIQEYEQNSIFVNQLGTNIALNERSEIDLGLSYNMTDSSLPDRRKINLAINEDVSLYEYTNFNIVGGSPVLNRYFSKMEDTEFTANLAYTYYLKEDSKDEYIKVGAFLKDKERDLNFSNIVVNSIDNDFMQQVRDDSELAGDSNYLYNNMDKYLADSKYWGTSLSIGDISQNPEQSFELKISSVYAKLSLQLSDDLYLLAGLRLDKVEQNTRYMSSGSYKSFYINKENILPQINLKYSLNEDNKLRLSASKTYSIPMFQEMSQMSYETEIGQVIGNSSLKQVDIYNIDMGWDWYPSAGSLFSVNLFYKSLKNPIEKVQITQSSTMTTSLINAKDAMVYGVELEWETNIGKLTNNESLNNLGLSINASLLESEANVPENTKQESLGASVKLYKKTHSLQGATPLLVNTDLSYKLPSIKSKASVSYNYNSKVITQLGSYNDNIYQEAISTLNFKWKTNVNKRLDISFSAKNLLDPKYEYTQKVAGRTKVINTYNRGVTFSLSLKYKFID